MEATSAYANQDLVGKIVRIVMHANQIHVIMVVNANHLELLVVLGVSVRQDLLVDYAKKEMHVIIMGRVESMEDVSLL